MNTPDDMSPDSRQVIISVIVPCFNESATLRQSVHRLLAISEKDVSLQVIIVDDCSTDESSAIAHQLSALPPHSIQAIRHEKNSGKGAAIRTGIAAATGDLVAIHDADLEYDPHDLINLARPIINGEADVVFGSRFLSAGTHRILYFWHSVGNRLLTLLSNMFTDLNMTDMESCYKIFRRDLLKQITLQENRFGFEPEIVARVAALRPRIYEMGISYYGRTYAEGKKIKWLDGIRALFCIVRYNAPQAPILMQFLSYAMIGGLCGAINLLFFLTFQLLGLTIQISAATSYFTTGLISYLFSNNLVFRHKAKWSRLHEALIALLLIILIIPINLWLVIYLTRLGHGPVIALIAAWVWVLPIEYLARRYLVFFEPPAGPWKPS